MAEYCYLLANLGKCRRAFAQNFCFEQRKTEITPGNSWVTKSIEVSTFSWATCDYATVEEVSSIIQSTVDHEAGKKCRIPLAAIIIRPYSTPKISQCEKAKISVFVFVWAAIRPGLTQLTRMPCGAHSFAICCKFHPSRHDIAEFGSIH